MEETINQFVSFLRDIKHVSENTAISYKRDLMKMSGYYGKQGIISPEKVTETNMNTYILWLEKNGCAPTTISRYIASIKSYFHYLLQMGRVKKDPTMLLKGPVLEKKNPNVLSVETIACLLQQPSGDGVKEIRDKAMLELLYATGMKASELISLEMNDVNLNLGYVVCRDKKKERIVPFGLSAKEAINRYLDYSREELLKGKESDIFFLNCSGKKMSRQGFWKIIKYYGERAGIKEEITPQILRHSFAMHLVENGANLHAVQEMMGHSVVATTQIYANMKRTKLNEEYSKAHPRM